MKKFVVMAVLATCVMCAAHAQPSVVWQNDNWQVWRSVNNMTDKVSCRALLKANPRVQIARDSIVLGLQATPRLVDLRYGSDAAEPSRLPTTVEEQVRAVMLVDIAVEQARQAGRVRASVMTTDGIEEFDVTLSDTEEIASTIVACEQG